MANLESYQLTHPELLSENELCEILKKTCIELNFENLNKAKLIEIYKRVALPLPQRSCKKKNDKHSETQKEESSPDRRVSLFGTPFNYFLDSYRGSNKEKENKSSPCKLIRVKPPVSESNNTAKKICLTNNSTYKDSLIKRKCDEEIKDSSQCSNQKRQKISWP